MIIFALFFSSMNWPRRMPCDRELQTSRELVRRIRREREVKDSE
jgi:hypothetical protein